MAAHVSFVNNTRASPKSNLNALARASMRRIFAGEEPEDKTSPLWDSWSRQVDCLKWMPLEEKYVAAVATDRITGEPVGSLLLEPSRCNDYVELTCLGVVHQRRGAGVGRALLTRTIDFVDRAIGANVPIVLSVEKTGRELSDSNSDSNSDSGTPDAFYDAYKRWELTMDDHDKLVEWYQGFGFRVENRLQRGRRETYMARVCDDQMLEDLVKFWNKDLDDEQEADFEAEHRMFFGAGVPDEYAQYIVEEQRNPGPNYDVGDWDDEESSWQYRRPYSMQHTAVNELNDYQFGYHFIHGYDQEPEGTWWWWFLQHNHPGNDVCVGNVAYNTSVEGYSKHRGRHL